MELRPYQHEAIEHTWQWLRNAKTAPVIVLPTGSGKSIVIAELARRVVELNRRVIVLAHRKELLEQNASELRELVPSLDVGIYSAGLKQRDTDHAVVFAGIQSVVNRASEFGSRSLVIVDEAHLVGPDETSGYRRFLEALGQCNPNLRLVGLTATPYRTSTGAVYGKDEIFGGVSYNAKLSKLIADGYLSRIVSCRAREEIETDSLRVKAGEFVQRDMEAAFDIEGVTQSAVAELVSKAAGRQSIMVFCAGVSHTKKVADKIRELTGDEVGVVTGETVPLERSSIIDKFKARHLRWIANCDVLTTGFNARGVDCVAVLRATCSPGLFAQMCGRGLRLFEGKTDCLILDFGQNLRRHGPLDADDYGVEKTKAGAGAPPEKRCPNPECREFVPAAAVICHHCGHKFMQDTTEKVRHEPKADNSPVLVDQQVKPTLFSVVSIRYSKHTKKKDGSVSLRVDYEVTEDGAEMPQVVSEYIGIGQYDWRDGFYGQKAKTWWGKRCQHANPVGIDNALAIANAGGLADCSAIKAVQEGRFWRITNYMLGEKPPEAIWIDRLDGKAGESIDGAEFGAYDEVPF
jgi:DNA repair protein RadD